MNELDKLKLTQLPFMIKDAEGNMVGQITAMVNNNLTNASFVLNFQSEIKVLNNKEEIKAAYNNMQDYFKRELIACGWGFLFENEIL